jgi:plastocyanin
MGVSRGWLSLAAAVVLAACGGSGPTDNGNPLQPPPGPPVAADTITIVDNAFGPQSVKVTNGGTVTWLWNSSNTQQHNVRWGTGPVMPMGSPTQSTGAPFEVVFTQPGTYEFVCSVHQGMQGAVFVE